MKLELRQVTKSFGSRNVLSGLDLQVHAGEVVSFIGSSGSGKTTLLRCVNLLEPIDDGAVLLDGDEISKIGRDPNPIRRRIGIVFQSFNLFPHISVVGFLSRISSVKLLPKDPKFLNRTFLNFII